METRTLDLAIPEISCALCANQVGRRLGAVEGVETVEVDTTAPRLTLRYNPAIVSPGRLDALAHDAEITAARPVRHEHMDLTGLDCTDCAATLEGAIARLPGVIHASVSFNTATLGVAYRSDLLDRRQIVAQIDTLGYGVRSAPPAAGELPSFWQDRRLLVTGAASALLLLALLAAWTGLPPLVSTAGFALAIAIGGFPIARSGLIGLIRVRTLDMNALMTIAVIGAAAIGEWIEGAAVVVLFSIGGALEAYTMERARGAIRALMALAPNEATVLRDGQERRVRSEEVAPGEVIAIRPGERIPLDGWVVGGASEVDQAPITGESLPVEKRSGAEVFAGTINGTGYLEVQVSRPASQNTIAQIVTLVTEAQARRAPSEQVVDRLARVYTPLVILGAVALAAVPWLGFGQDFAPWFYRALVLLVIACPCALVISTPVSIVAGLAQAARRGVLIKGGAPLEALGGLRAIAFDKTGTLSAGQPEVTAVLPLPSISEEEVLRVAAAVEARSEHPFAAAILRRAGATPSRGVGGDFAAMVGRGARATVDGAPAYVGSAALFADLAIPTESARPLMAQIQAAGATALLVGRNEAVIGAIGVADRVRPQAPRAVERLRRAGLQPVVMLTGDHPSTAAAVGKAVGVDEVQAGLLPAAKLEAVRALTARYGKVGMVGDGVNDAPALAAATVGIAMGGSGTDVALETADVTLMGDDLTKLPEAIALGRATVRTIRQNVTFALGIKLLFLALAVPGLTTLWLAILADVGASVLVTLNGMRLLRHQGGITS